MKKAIFMSLAAVSALSANEIDEAFEAGIASGYIRMVYIDQNNDVSADTYTTAIGGILKYETAAWHDLKLGVGAYISQKIVAASGSGEYLNYDLLSTDNDSFAYVGEAYVDYSSNGVSIRIGRQLLDTPFADTDDIRMVPNTFEAAIATYSALEGTTFLGGYATRWSGYDSGDDISQFKKLGGDDSDGVAVVGIVNESVENLALQGWYYAIDEVSNALYTDATYAIPFSETMGLELSAQYANFSEEKESGMDGNVYGVGAVFNIGALTLGAAYNKASNDTDKYVSNGFGGGPYMTSMEEMTIDGYEDAKAYQFSAELDMADAGLEGLTLTALYGNFKSTPANMKVKEIDLIAVYEISEALSAEVSYAMVDDKNKNTSEDGLYDGGYDRFLARISYNF